MDFNDILVKRRSINFFDTKKDLDIDILEKIINNAVLAPSAFNLQPWEIIVVKSSDNKSKLFKACPQPKVLEAPVTLIIIGDTFGYGRDNPIWNKKIEIGMSEEQISQMINVCENKIYPTEIKRNAMAVRNASLLSMSIMYCAKNLGVDSHPMIGFDEDMVKELFEIDESKTVVMLLSLGYLDEEKTLNPREHRFGFKDICKIV